MSASETATAAIVQLVARLSYKPGTKFNVVPDATSMHDPAVYIDMHFPCECSVTGEASSRDCGLHIPEDVALDASIVLALIRERLVISEMHELDEFLKFDGERINDPHGAPLEAR